MMIQVSPARALAVALGFLFARAAAHLDPC
jgi:hypothetical protein